MNTANFRTPQKITSQNNPKTEKEWLVAIDAGFSSMKCFAPDKYICFPSYVRKLDTAPQLQGKSDILYLDNEGLYLVGASAQNQIQSDDTNETEAEWFTRNRYRNKKFLVLLATTLGLAVRTNPGLPIVIQTGLPTAYLPTDTKSIIKAFAQKYEFSLKLGESPWMKFNFEVLAENVYVMAQPAGTLYSALINDRGEYLPDAGSLLRKNLIVADVGFGTFDPYGIVQGSLILKESISNLGMRRVLEETSRLIYDECGEDIRVTNMQKFLEKGYFYVLNEETMESEQVYLAPFLEKANRQVCMESIETLKGMTNFLRDYEVMILTGGTCAAWLPLYQEHFKNMKSLTILAGNRNNSLPLLYSNVRGYYMFRYMNLKVGGRA